MLKSLVSNVRHIGAAIGVAAALACAAPAQAVVFVGRWDPAFGAAFPDLGWRGEARFFIPDACLALSGVVLNSDPCSSSGMHLLDGEVEFYKVSDPNNPAFHETLVFDLPSSNVSAMEVTGNFLSGVFGTFGYSRTSTLPLAGGPLTDFVLFFDGPVAQMSFVSRAEAHPASGLSDSRPVITFFRVSEPGTLALVLAGLGVVGILRRRERQPAV